MKLANLLLFTVATIRISIAQLPPDARWICQYSPDVVETKCQVDPGFVNNLERQYGIPLGTICRDPWGEFERICRGRKEVFAKSQLNRDEICRDYGPYSPELVERVCAELPWYCNLPPPVVFHEICYQSRKGEVFAKSQFDRDAICRDYGPYSPELVEKICTELPRYCDLPPEVVFHEICIRRQPIAKVQQPDLGHLCQLRMPPEDLHQLVCTQYPKYCGEPLDVLCPSRPRSFAKFQQPDPIRRIPVFLRIADLCKSVEQPGTNLDHQKMVDLCNTAPQTEEGDGVLPPFAAKAKETIDTLCYPTVTDDVHVVRMECDELRKFPGGVGGIGLPRFRDEICSRRPDLPICNGFPITTPPMV